MRWHLGHYAIPLRPWEPIIIFERKESKRKARFGCSVRSFWQLKKQKSMQQFTDTLQKASEWWCILRVNRMHCTTSYGVLQNRIQNRSMTNLVESSMALFHVFVAVWSSTHFGRTKPLVKISPFRAQLARITEGKWMDRSITSVRGNHQKYKCGKQGF